MLGAVLGVMPSHTMAYLRGSDLAFFGRKRNHLVSAVFNGARLVHGYMTRFGRNHALIGAQNAAYDRGVGLCAAHQKMHLGMGCLASFLDEAACVLAMRVLAIAHVLFHIGTRKSAQNFGGTALVIVTLKLDFHTELSIFLS